MAISGKEVFRAVLNEVRARKQKGRPLVVFITGIDASGKTCFARECAGRLVEAGYLVQIVHMDDFHNARETRYRDSGDLAQQYYNNSFDIAALVSNVLEPIASDRILFASLTHRDVLTDKLEITREYVVSGDTIVLVEGVFLWRPELRRFCDLLIYVHVPFHLAVARAQDRDVPLFGSDVITKYYRKYLPAQIRYLKACRPIRAAALVVDNCDWQNPILLSAESLFSVDVKLPNQRGLCFDFWNTLVPLSDETRQIALSRTAALLNVDIEWLKPRWRRTRNERETQPLPKYLKSFCDREGLPASDGVIERITEMRVAVFSREIAACRGTLECLLGMIASQKYRLGLISNCTSELQQILERYQLTSTFDHLALSSSVGLMKPSREIFLSAASGLGLMPEECIYVGDGSDDELSAARSAGMCPVLLRPPHGREWDGYAFDSLDDALYGLIS